MVPLQQICLSYINLIQSVPIAIAPLSNIGMDLHLQTMSKFATELFAKVLHKDSPKTVHQLHSNAMQMDAAPPVLET